MCGVLPQPSTNRHKDRQKDYFISIDRLALVVTQAALENAYLIKYQDNLKRILTYFCMLTNKYKTTKGHTSHIQNIN